MMVRRMFAVCGLVLSVLVISFGFIASAEASVTPVAYYRLGDADPGAVIGAAGASIAADSAGTNPLNRTGNPVYAAPAPYPTGNSFAMTFDGNSYYQASLAISPITDFGVEAWVRPSTSYPSANRMIFYNGSGQYGFGLYQAGGQFYWLNVFNWAGTPTAIGPAPANQWTHIAVVRYGLVGDNRFELYLNGILQVTLTNGNGLIQSAGSKTTIGADIDGLETFVGDIDEVRMFTFALNGFNATTDLLAPPVPTAPATIIPGSSVGQSVGFFNGGAVVTVTANGSVDISDGNGSYITDPNGVVLPPGSGSGANSFFTGNSTPVGISPQSTTISVWTGQQRLPIGGLLESNNFPYGALLGAWAATAAPGVGDSRWFQVGSSATLTAPAGGSRLWLVVNDFGQPAGDNNGYFIATPNVSNTCTSAPSVSITGGGLLSSTAVSLTAVISGGASPFTYSWSRNGFVIPGNSSFISDTLTQAWNTYAVTVTDGLGCVSNVQTVPVMFFVPQTISVTTHAPSSAPAGSPFSVAATASSGLSVSITAAGACSGSGTGSATITLAASGTTCTVNYNQGGNNTYGPAPQVTDSTTLLYGIAQTITVTSHAPLTAVFNSSFTVQATASSGLAVAITVTGACSLTSGGSGSATIKITGSAGTCTVNYNQVGSAGYVAAPQVNDFTTAMMANPTIAWAPPPPSAVAVNETFTLIATTDSGDPLSYSASGVGVCTISGTAVTITSTSGSCTVTATDPGNANFFSGSISATVNAAKLTPAISWTSPAPSIATNNSLFNVAAITNSGNTLNYTASGGACSSNGATVTITSASGTCMVTASDPGNSNYYPGSAHTFTINATSAAAWGFGVSGQLGNGASSSSTVPVQVSGLSHAAAISVGASHTVALTSDGTVWAWGLGTAGQLGNGASSSSNVPVHVSGLSNVVAIAAGFNHSLALTSDGAVWAWGLNRFGQLGNGSLSNSSVPVHVSGLSNVVAIAGGGNHSLALTSDGTVWAWGNGTSGQLGNNISVSKVPVHVSGLSNVVAIAGGANHSLALKSGGTVWAWGLNSSGQLGNGLPLSVSSTPTEVLITLGGSALSGVVAVAGGNGHSMALKSDGTVWTWGLGTSGQLGSGNLLSSLVPVEVAGSGGSGILQNVVAIAAGSNASSSLALLADATVWGWGLNTLGELGDGNITSPVTAPVRAGSILAAAIGGVSEFAAALNTNGGLVPIAQSITVTNHAPSTAVYNSSFSVTATASSGLAVSITGAGACSGNGSGAATITTTGGAGVCTVQYNQPGNATYGAAPVIVESVNATPLSLSASVTVNDKTYDGTTSATLSNCKLTSVAGTDNVTCSAASAAFIDKNAGTAKAVSVTGIAISGTDSGNYALANTSASTTANIAARSLTVTATGQNKVYDGGTSATVTLSDNRIAGDVLTDTYSSASFATSNTGTGIAVSVSGIAISGADAGNYTANSTASASANITPPQVTVTASSAQMVYSSAVPVITAGYSGFVAGQTNSVLTAQPVCSTTATSTSPVANYPSSCSGAAAANYTFTYVNGAVAITKATPVITWPAPANIAYPTALSSTQLNATASVAGTFVYNPPAGTVLAPGTQTLSVTFTPNDTSNYSNATATVSIAVDSSTSLSLSSGQNVTMTNGTVSGSVTISNGSSLTLNNSQVAGNVTINNGGTLVVNGTTVINGNVNLKSGGTVTTNGGSVTNNLQISGNSTFSLNGIAIGTNLQIQNVTTSSGANQICGINASNNLDISGNAVAVTIGGQSGSCGGNTIGGNLNITSNTGAISVSNNTISQNLQCTGNSSITGSGNTAKAKQGQCSAF